MVEIGRYEGFSFHEQPIGFRAKLQAKRADCSKKLRTFRYNTQIRCHFRSIKAYEPR